MKKFLNSFFILYKGLINHEINNEWYFFVLYDHLLKSYFDLESFIFLIIKKINFKYVIFFFNLINYFNCTCFKCVRIKSTTLKDF